MVAKRAATAPERLAWVGIYPLDPDSPMERAMLQRAGFGILPNRGVRAYNVRTFELDLALHDTWVAEPDLQNKADYVVVGDEALFSKLEELGVSTDSIEVPWKTDYPI